MKARGRTKRKIMLEKEFKYFLEHQTDLVKKYNGRFVVIVGENVVGDYETEVDAYNNSLIKYKAGTFLIKRCISGEEAYKQTYHSRVTFA